MTVDIFDGGGAPVYPDIAVNSDGSSHDITDGISGQPNVSTPASPIPANGWPGNGIPIFSDFNKLFRLVTQWIRYLYSAFWGDDNLLFLNASLTHGGWFELPVGWTNQNTLIVSSFVETAGGSRYPTPYSDHEGNFISLKMVTVSGRVRIEVSLFLVAYSIFPVSPQWRIVVAKIIPKTVLNDDGNPTTWAAENIS
jgi:hypothetical protein